MEENSEELERALRARILQGEELSLQMVELKNIPGARKLVKKIEKEVKFLEKVLKNGNIKEEHVKCTNLVHLSAVVACARKHKENCSAILEHFEYLPIESKRLCVDVIADSGKTWFKVIARNPKALSILSAGDGEFGQRSVLDQAEDFIKCANEHHFQFEVPKVVFLFANGIDSHLAKELHKIGIIVQGTKIDNVDQSHISLMKEENENSPEESVKQNRVLHLNLDVTAMIAYVSSLTNGGCNFYFKEPVLSQQAKWERKKPVKPILDNLFQGKKLFCCTTAKKDFTNIIQTLGGPFEKRRAEILLEKVTVVPDEISERAKNNLVVGGKVKPRSQIIFGTGDFLEAITVTANEGFVRAAKCQGICFAVFIHDSRALTESKECFAEPIPQKNGENTSTTN